MEGVSKSIYVPDSLIQLVWGPNINPELFSRWSQGFVFSSSENTCLLQTRAGPCAVIAPVQAFLLKRLISLYDLNNMRKLSAEVIEKSLAFALTEILSQCIDDDTNQSASPELLSAASHAEEMSKANKNGVYIIASLDSPFPATSSNDLQHRDCASSAAAVKDCTHLHNNIRFRKFDSKHTLQNFLEANLELFKTQYGILLFLYSVILTKGCSAIKSEVGDSNESLIEPSAGHGGQALINLLLTGRASSYVWDIEKDIGGMRLSGIMRRPAVGFLTCLEQLNYVKVGWYLKNPKSPIWVLASETHLTVLFSWMQNLVTPNTEVERAKQAFTWFDTEGNGFIRRDQIKPLLQKLNLCTDADFIQFMCSELDPENMGIILFHKFLEAFYNTDQSYSPPDTFIVYHYNGLEASFPEGQAQYAEGSVTLQETPVSFVVNQSDILSCLSTKWPNLDVLWTPFQPSLN